MADVNPRTCDVSWCQTAVTGGHRLCGTHWSRRDEPDVALDLERVRERRQAEHARMPGTYWADPTWVAKNYVWTNPHDGRHQSHNPALCGHPNCQETTP